MKSFTQRLKLPNLNRSQYVNLSKPNSITPKPQLVEAVVER